LTDHYSITQIQNYIVPEYSPFNVPPIHGVLSIVNVLLQLFHFIATFFNPDFQLLPYRQVNEAKRLIGLGTKGYDFAEESYQSCDRDITDF
jgi:hypothetical protein